MIGFYNRRVRRLFPAALTVIVLTLVATHQYFSGARFKDTFVDGLYATLFSANWHFIRTGTNYFTASGPVSPFQHYWSLSVEEQFYLAWPAMLLVVLYAASRATAGRDPARVRRATGLGLAAALILVTFYVAYRASSDTPVQAYFSTFTRGWELGLGALLAAVGTRVRA